MPHWAHRICVSALIFALLTVPCLSVAGMFAPDTAHAHHAISGHKPGTIFHRAGDTARHHGEAGLTHAVHDGAAHRHSGDSAEKCCRLCIGWVNQADQDDWPALRRASGSSPEKSSKPPVWAIAFASAMPLPARLPGGGTPLRQAESVQTPLYALTGRLRL